MFGFVFAHLATFLIDLATTPRPQAGSVECRDALGGLLRDYHREAA